MSGEQSDPVLWRVGQVAHKTGLSVHVLRVWERRYGAVDPKRTAKGARLYTGEQVERLDMLARLVKRGHSIGLIARLADQDLRDWLAREQPEAAGVAPPASSALGISSGGLGLGSSSPGLGARLPSVPALSPARAGTQATLPKQKLIQRFIDALERMDTQQAEQVVTEAALLLPRTELLDDVLTPILQQVGEGWEKGRLSVYQEHAATRVLFRLIDRLMAEPGARQRGLALAAALSGERHELGAMMATLTAVDAGFRAIPLGGDLPPAEVALAAGRLRADVLLLSFVATPEPVAVHQLDLLFVELDRQELAIRVVVGGSHAPSHPRVVNVPSLAALRGWLLNFGREPQ